ncbi:MAG: histidine--tRNA ligase [Candidatus Nanogingivalis sp.]
MKINTKPLPGMLELLPEEQLEFDRILEIIRKNHAKFGFSPIDTPVIERTETLLAKAGGETEKQIYRFNKGDNDLSLRFDLTVPTARFVAENFGQLQFPFKRSQIGKVYRGERAQRGRFREFYQCDIDVIGRDTLSVNYDAEVIAVIYEIFRELNFGKFKIRINNRNITSGLLEGLNLLEKSTEIMALIDRAEKISSEEFDSQLSKMDLGEQNFAKIKQFISISGKSAKIIDELQILGETFENNSRFLTGVSELEKVAKILKKMGVSEDFFKLDMLIVRGLDYYTGTVFETFLDDFREIGSVSSGGRYDNLSEYYSKEKLPGVGASIGLTRLFWCLRDLGLLSPQKRSTADFLIIPFSENELEKSFEIAKQLRESGKNVEVLLEQMKIAKAFKFADKRGVNFTLVIGEQEIAENRFEFKDMKTGEKIPLEDLLKN